MFTQFACGQRESISNPNNQQKMPDKKLENLKQQAKEFYQAQFDSDIKILSKFIYYPKIVKESAEKGSRVKDIQN